MVEIKTRAKKRTSAKPIIGTNVFAILNEKWKVNYLHSQKIVGQSLRAVQTEERIRHIWRDMKDYWKEGPKGGYHPLV